MAKKQQDFIKSNQSIAKVKAIRAYLRTQL